MNEQTAELQARTKKFALDVIRCVRSLPRTGEGRTIGGQLIRSATGVGANYRAVCRSRSRPEFVAKLGVALEEADESSFWLEIIVELQMVAGDRAMQLLDEANQLTAILAASRITAGGGHKR
jgi:four helix bundle protein